MQLSNKMRPMHFKDVKGQKYVVQALMRQSQMDQWFNCYIFSGQFGGGKTTMARLVALAANCTNKNETGEPCLHCDSCQAILNGCEDVTEIDGASNTGVDHIRRLQEVVACSPMRLKKRVIIIDEVHMLSQGAFNSALKMLEEPPAHCIFILCTTEAAAIPQTIMSRSAHYNFSRLNMEELVSGIADAAERLDITISAEAMEIIAAHANGSMRNAMVLLDQLLVDSNVIDEKLCRSILGITDGQLVMDLIEAILDQNLEKAMGITGMVISQGESISNMAADINARCTDLLIAKRMTGNMEQLCCTGDVKERIMKIAERYSFHYLAFSINVLSDFAKAAKLDQTREGLYIGCASAISRLFSNELGLLERIQHIEKAIKSGKIFDNPMCEERSICDTEIRKREQEDFMEYQEDIQTGNSTNTSNTEITEVAAEENEDSKHDFNIFDCLSDKVVVSSKGLYSLPDSSDNHEMCEMATGTDVLENLRSQFVEETMKGDFSEQLFDDRVMNKMEEVETDQEYIPESIPESVSHVMENEDFSLPTPHNMVVPDDFEEIKEDEHSTSSLFSTNNNESETVTVEYKQEIEKELAVFIEHYPVLRTLFYFHDAQQKWEGNTLMLIVSDETDFQLLRSYLTYEELNGIDVRLER